MMKIKRKLTSLLLMVAVVIALLPAIGTKDVKADDLLFPILEDEHYTVTLYINPYPGKTIEEACYAYDGPKIVFQRGSRTVELTESWYDNGREMKKGETFVEGKRYTYKAFFKSESTPTPMTYFPLSYDNFNIIDYQTMKPFVWESKWQIDDFGTYIEVTYVGDFVAGRDSADQGSSADNDTVKTKTGTYSAESVKTTTGTYSVQNGEATFTAPAKKSAKTVTVPATIKAGGKTVKVTAIAPNALKGMKKLTKVTIGSNVTTIGKNAFANDAKLTTVTIGKNVKSIGAKAFYKCKALKKITIKTKKLTKKTIGSKAFTGINKKAVIKSPKAKKAAYKKILLKKGMKKTMTFK